MPPRPLLETQLCRLHSIFHPIRCFKDILEAEEDRVETGLARVDMEATGLSVILFFLMVGLPRPF